MLCPRLARALLTLVTCHSRVFPTCSPLVSSSLALRRVPFPEHDFSDLCPCFPLLCFPSIGTLDRSHAMRTWLARKTPRPGLFCMCCCCMMTCLSDPVMMSNTTFFSVVQYAVYVAKLTGSCTACLLCCALRVQFQCTPGTYVHVPLLAPQCDECPPR